MFENFPDAVWRELKLWAKSQAEAPEIPTLAQCATQVERIAKKLTGVSNALRPDVVAFYATETSDMIARFKALLLNE